MQGVKEKAIQLLKDGVVDRVIGWKAGEFFYDLTPAVFTSAEEVENVATETASTPNAASPKTSSTSGRSKWARERRDSLIIMREKPPPFRRTFPWDDIG